MKVEELFRRFSLGEDYDVLHTALIKFISENESAVAWHPVGDKINNKGIIEVSADPGRALVERVTNAIDAVLELEHDKHNGQPICMSPREAATAWLSVPREGLSKLSPAERRSLAQKVKIIIQKGKTRQYRIFQVRDFGIGISLEDMPKTILSLNESNKLSKHYLAGTYGQGGSATFNVSQLTFVASRKVGEKTVSFTLVKYQELDPERYKTGNYVYLTINGSLPTLEVDDKLFPAGTLVRHFGYDLSKYNSSLGSASVYGLLNQVLFDPVLPIWLDDEVQDYRRTIKGSRNALNGAVDEEGKGPGLAHNMPMFYVELPEHGLIGIEYWVLEKPTAHGKNPAEAFVNSSKPVVLTLNGQNHAELPKNLLTKETGLPYLSNRVIVHIDCNNLTGLGKRKLFVSNREDVRQGHVLELIKAEIVKALNSDDVLVKLNSEAKQSIERQRDETSVKEMKAEVARLLRLQGLSIADDFGASGSKGKPSEKRPVHPRPRPITPPAIETHEPPTYFKILWEQEKPITFYTGQRRYLRIVTDANETYHNVIDPSLSRVNVILPDGQIVEQKGSTPLRGGRMRLIVQGVSDDIGQKGKIRVELNRVGLPVLFDEREIEIIKEPEKPKSESKPSLPPFDVIPVSQSDSDNWSMLQWPDNVTEVACSAVEDQGVHTVYYNTDFPKYAEQKASLESRDESMSQSFTKRYEIWLAVHSLLMKQDEENGVNKNIDIDPEILTDLEQRERIRSAILSVMFAKREVQFETSTDSEE